MTKTTVYATSAVSVRKRRTNAELEDMKAEIFSIARSNQPCSSRSIYYIGIGRLWEKDINQKRTVYQRVNRWIGEMRENGELPWEWITDSTRLVRIPDMHDSVEEALLDAANFYRRNLWRKQPNRVEVWCESDSVGAMLHTVTNAMGVGLYSCRGQAGKGFVHEAVQQWRRLDKPVTVLYVGDWDPSGMAIPTSVHDRMMRYSNGEVDLTFERIAVTAEDIATGAYISHAANTKDKNYRRFREMCVDAGVDPTLATEVEAIPAPVLRQRLRDAIEENVVHPSEWNAVLAAEESERELMLKMAGRAS